MSAPSSSTSSPAPLRRLALLAIAVLALLLTALAAPAMAGGPTSVLIVDYTTGRAAAALIGSSAYQALADALDVNSGVTGSARPPEGVDPHDRTIRLNWFLHDRELWRVDTIVLGTEPLIVATDVINLGDRDAEPWPTSWHEVQDPAQFMATLSDLGMLGDGDASAAAADAGSTDAQSPGGESAASAADRIPQSTGPSAVPGPDPVAAAQAPTTTAGESGPAGVTGLAVGLAVVVGAALGWGASWLVRGRRS